jgi:hypothetical protein
MTRAAETKKDAVHVLAMRIEDLAVECERWHATACVNDTFSGKMLEARIALQKAIVCVAEAENLMPEEER